jgi:DNA-binding SARP family transcriptional activator
LDLAQDQTETAAEHLREALRWFQIAHRPPDIVQTLENLASVLAMSCQVKFSARLLAATRAWRAARDAPIPPSDREAYDRTIERVRFVLGPEELASLDSVARLLTIDQAVADAVGLAPSTAVQVQPPVMSIFALGTTRVLVGDRTVAAPEWKYNKSKELFYYLLVNPPATKAQIGLDLWADASPEQLRRDFHRTLHYMRKALGHADWIAFTGGVYTFSQSINLWYDVREFESRLAEVKSLLKSGMPQSAERGRACQLLAEAIQLWRGDFLADMDAGEWAVAYRESLRSAYIQALMDLGRLHVANAHYSDAIDVYRRVLASDDYFEDAHRELMRCYARLGETRLALKHYRSQRQLLKDELGAEPSPETTLLYERLRRGDDV